MSNNNYLTEAFQDLKLLDEDVFSYDADGAKELRDFLDADDIEEQTIIDPEAADESELKDSYVGDVVLSCCVCKSMIYKKPEDVIVDEDSELVNVEEECPYCYSTEGFEVVGQIAPYEPNKGVVEEEPEVEVKEEEAVKLEEGKHEEKSLWDEIYGELTEDGTLKMVDNTKGNYMPQINKGAGYDYKDQVAVDRDGNIVVKAAEEHDLKKAIDVANKYADKGITYNISKSKYDKKYKYWLTVEIPEEFKESLNEAKVKKGKLNPLEKLRKKFPELREENETKKLEEDIDKVEVTADEQKVTVTEKDDATVVEIKKDESVEKVEEETGETIIPLQEPVKDEIERNVADDEYADEEEIDIDDFDEGSFDELGESYLKEVYDNVAEYKTENVKQNGESLLIEGVITFNSGKKVKTTFRFEGYKKLRGTKLQFLGENKQFARKKNSFMITGNLEGGSLICESLTYNYSAKDAKGGKAIRLYGKVTRK